jgi:hypothetical protein
MTAIGANTITSMARHFIMPQITDQIYGSTVLLYRLMKGNKRMVQGGTQIEVPLMYRRFATGGAYSGYDVFDTTPHDTIRNAVFNWKQHQVTWSVDGLTMLKADSPLAIANFLTLQSQQAYMEMAENLASEKAKSEEKARTYREQLLLTKLEVFDKEQQGNGLTKKSFYY